jgi:MFS family permease
VHLRGPLLPLFAATTVLTLGEGAFSLLVPPYMHARHLSPVTIGGAVSAYGLVSLATRIPAGALYRSRRAWMLIAVGSTLSSLAFALVTRTSDPTLLTIFVSLDGAGFAISTTATMAALIERKPPGGDAGSIMGWYTGSIGAGYGLSGIVGGTLGGHLGPADAILVLALVPLAAGVGLSLAIRGSAAVEGPPPAASPAARTRSAWWHGFRSMPRLVWLAFAVTLYVNLVSGVVLTFFPIYGLAIGLTLTQIGVLQGIQGFAASIVRFLSGVVFRWVSYERVLPAMVVCSGLSVLLIGGVRSLGLLVVAWCGLGLTRGLLRVASAALVMDAAGEADARSGGASSGVYLAGLDLGKVVGPLLGGASAGALGLRPTFLLAGVAFPAVYFALSAVLRRSARGRAARATADAGSTLG